MTKNQLLTRFMLSNFSQIEQPPFGFAKTTASAVLIPLVERDNQINIILTKRSSHLRHHPNQVSFPGGKADACDSSLKCTALRENFEELGIHATSVEIFGQLPNLTTITGFDIKPFIGFVSPDTEFFPNPNEVSDVIELPLYAVLNNANHFTLTVPRGGNHHVVYFKPTGGWAIWGATATIIEQLRLVFH